MGAWASREAGTRRLRPGSMSGGIGGRGVSVCRIKAADDGGTEGAQPCLIDFGLQQLRITIPPSDALGKRRRWESVGLIHVIGKSKQTDSQEQPVEKRSFRPPLIPRLSQEVVVGPESKLCGHLPWDARRYPLVCTRPVGSWLLCCLLQPRNERGAGRSCHASRHAFGHHSR